MKKKVFSNIFYIYEALFFIGFALNQILKLNLGSILKFTGIASVFLIAAMIYVELKDKSKMTANLLLMVLVLTTMILISLSI